MNFRVFTYSNTSRHPLVIAVISISKCFLVTLHNIRPILSRFFPEPAITPSSLYSGLRKPPLQQSYTHPTSHLYLAHQALHFSYQEHQQFHDLEAMPQLSELSRTLVLDLGEDLAARGLVEVTYRASRMYIRITSKGIAYMKKQEKELQPYNTNFYCVA